MTEHSIIVPQPLPACDIHIRLATRDDLAFIDGLQKKHSKQVGWMPTGTLEGKISAGHVLIAEENEPRRHGGTEVRLDVERPSVSQCLRGEPLGYCIAADQYFKRDDVGVIYQMNVVPGKQRALVGASLLKAQFDRSAYGCKLYCCWCAQDIAANQFWEAMGFVPLAFRTGGRGVGSRRAAVGSESGGDLQAARSEMRSPSTARVHIFWQKRIRAGDTTTPWWFPSKTAGGSIREDRIVLPIPPGTHWSDAKPLILPGQIEAPALPEPKAARGKKKEKPVETPKAVRRNGLMFDIPQQGEPLPEMKQSKEQKPKAARVKRACDPRLVAAARELRDRWLEGVNAGAYLLEARGKYEVGRTLDVGTAEEMRSLPSLNAA